MQQNPFITSGIAIIAAVLAAYITLLQVRRNNITAARLKWITELKIYISDVIKISNAVLISKNHFQQLINDGEDSEIEQKKKIASDIIGNILELTRVISLVSLNLNKSEFLAMALITKMTELILLVNKPQDTNVLIKYEPILEDVLVIATHILKVEWEVTKRSNVKSMDKGNIETYTTNSIQKVRKRLSSAQLDEVKKWNDYYYNIKV